jgi:anti-anti-sigma factor
MSAQKDVERTFAVAKPHGRVDAATAPELEAQLYELLSQGEAQIVVDMTEVSYISSSGLKVLLAALRQARRQGGNLALCNLQPKVSAVLEMAGFDFVFPIGQDLAAAIRLLEQAQPPAQPSRKGL